MKEYIVPVGDKGNMNMIENELYLQQLVRCKDCKKLGTDVCPVFSPKNDWFCADGEARK